MLQELLNEELVEVTVEFTEAEAQLAEEMAGGCGCLISGRCNGSGSCDTHF